MLRWLTRLVGYETVITSILRDPAHFENIHCVHNRRIALDGYGGGKQV